MIQPIISSPVKGEINSQTLKHLVDKINEVFLVSESKLWPHDGTYYRTTVEELKSFIEKGQIRIAKMDDLIVGLIKVYQKRNGVGGFGLLMVDPAYRQFKIGTQLVQVAEDWCKTVQLSAIELELLVANDFVLEDKIILREWYGRRGYQWIEKTAFETLYPSHAGLIQVPCSFEIMRKKLN